LTGVWAGACADKPKAISSTSAVGSTHRIFMGILDFQSLPEMPNRTGSSFTKKFMRFYRGTYIPVSIHSIPQAGGLYSR
jgi:hypothetical protein